MNPITLLITTRRFIVLTNPIITVLTTYIHVRLLEGLVCGAFQYSDNGAIETMNL